MSNLKELKREYKKEIEYCTMEYNKEFKNSATVQYVKALEKENRELKKAIKVVSPMTRIGAKIYSKPIELNVYNPVHGHKRIFVKEEGGTKR